MPTQQRSAEAAPGLPGAALAAKLREVTARLVAALTPERVLLFGSHAWGSPDADSDLDLYIVVADDSEPAHRAEPARRAQGRLRIGDGPLRGCQPPRSTSRSRSARSRSVSVMMPTRWPPPLSETGRQPM
jgi:hypothetical protein